MQEKRVTLEEAAALLNKSYHQIRTLVVNGTLPTPIQEEREFTITKTVLTVPLSAVKKLTK